MLSVAVNRTFEKIASKKSYTEQRDKQRERRRVRWVAKWAGKEWV